MKIKNKTLLAFLQQDGVDACSTGRVWALQNCTTLREVWEKCERSDWMLWVMCRLGVYDQSISHFLVKVLREQPIHEGKTLFDLLTDERSRKCVDVLEQFLDGKATLDEFKKARSDAADAAYAASDDAAYAAAAAANAADAAYYYAASAAANASDAAYDAAYAADDADAARRWQADALRACVVIEWEETP